MEIKQIGKIQGGQDGAIYKNELFRFNHKGECFVYNLADLNKQEDEKLKAFACFTLDRANEIVPHSNAVCFGCEFFEKGDEYPLLYSNIYNNYAKAEDKLIGVCLVYRLQKLNGEFKTTLVQMIEIGFCEDVKLWKTNENAHGIRPYGNFVVDNDKKFFWAFVMRDEQNSTRYFKFNLPKVSDGKMDSRYNVKKVVLKDSDVLEYFDQDYHHYIQGAILRENKVYSTEGFRNDLINRPAIRIIDLKTKAQKCVDIMELGFMEEPEFIDFYGDICLYSDYDGNLYKIEF